MDSMILVLVGVLSVSFLAVLALSRRAAVARVIASVVALGFAAFCGFGFLASFELSDSPLSVWHISYAILGTSSLVIAFLGLKSAWAQGGRSA